MTYQVQLFMQLIIFALIDFAKVLFIIIFQRRRLIRFDKFIPQVFIYRTNILPPKILIFLDRISIILVARAITIHLKLWIIIKIVSCNLHLCLIYFFLPLQIMYVLVLIHDFLNTALVEYFKIFNSSLLDLLHF